MLVSDTSKGERLLIIRRRAKRTQEEAAADYNVSQWIYSRWESGLGEPPDESIDEVKPGEHYMLIRKRAGITIKEVAAALGHNESGICKMERGEKPCLQLMMFWGDL